MPNTVGTQVIRDIYQISEKYGGLIAPESIITFQLIFFFLISECILSIARSWVLMTWEKRRINVTTISLNTVLRYDGIFLA